MMRRLCGILWLGIGVGFAVCTPALADRKPQQNFILRCLGCHGADGSGSAIGGIPTFLGSISQLANDDAGRTYMVHVPGMSGAGLNDAEAAAVMTYINDTFGDAPAPPFDPAEIARRRAIPVPDVVVMRRQIAARLAADGKPIADYPWP